MARITPTPLFMRDVVLQIGTDVVGADFAVGVDSVTFTPSTSTVTYTGLGAQSFSQTATASYTLDLSYAQDWDSEVSLSRFLYEHEGETHDVTFTPRNGIGPSFQAEVVITPGAIGGAVNTYAVTTVSLGVNGKPVLVEA